MKSTFFLLLFFVAVLCSCGGTKKSYSEHSYSEEAIALNNEATQLMIYADFSAEKERDSLLNKALQKLDEAIAIDSLNIVIWQNKVQILMKFCRYQETLVALEQVLKTKESPEAVTMLGLTYERMGDTLSARKHYQKALVAYDKLLVAEPDSYLLLLNKYFILLSLEADEETLAQMRKVLNSIPDPTGMNRNMVAELEHFNREELFNNLFGSRTD